jgi:phosphatidylserine/phosphatidylglycerophosphate/cardiolipin synthase-like enzyme
MANGLCRTIRHLAPWAALLLFIAPAASAQTRQAKDPGVTSPSGCGAQLLRDGDYFPALLEAIDRARGEIVLSAFFFKTNGFAENRPDRVLERLREAVRRGVTVEAVIERGQEGDNVSKDNADTAKRLKQSGIRVCFDSPDRTTHAKLVAIDRRTLFIGSHNLTQSALKYNREVSVRIDSPVLAEEALRYLRSLCP